MQEYRILDTTPDGLATLLDDLAEPLQEQDPDVAQELSTAACALRTLSWHRSTRLLHRQGAAGRLRRRHQAQGRHRVVVGSYVRKPRALWLEEGSTHA